MKKFIALTAVLAALCSCNKNESGLLEDSEIRFKISYPGLSTRANDSSFEISDVVGLYMTAYNGDTPSALQVSGNQVNNAKIVFDGKNWNANPKMYWEKGVKYDAYAYYPYSEPTSVDEYEFMLSLDQNSPKSEATLGGYEASDLLWAKAQGVSWPDDVSLKFRHILSRLVVNLVKGEDFEGEMPENVELRLHSTVAKAIVDLSNGVVLKDPYAPASTIQAKKIGKYKFEAIVVPQTISFKEPLVEILVNNVSYLVELRLAFKQGVSQTLNVILDSDPAKVKIEIGGEIEGWE